MDPKNVENRHWQMIAEILGVSEKKLSTIKETIFKMTRCYNKIRKLIKAIKVSMSLIIGLFRLTPYFERKQTKNSARDHGTIMFCVPVLNLR